MLGVPREGVTLAAGALQENGLIIYRRGHIKMSTVQGSSTGCVSAMAS